MSRLNTLSFSYSYKNIRVADKTQYRRIMVEKLESFLRRVRWKVFFYENPEAKGTKKVEKFGLKSLKTPPCRNCLLFLSRSWSIWCVLLNIESTSVGRFSSEVLIERSMRCLLRRVLLCGQTRLRIFLTSHGQLTTRFWIARFKKTTVSAAMELSIWSISE